MEKQSYFRIKMQAAIDRLIENSLKPFDPFGFSQFLEQNKSQPVPYELKSQETRETLYIIQNEMRKNLHVSPSEILGIHQPTSEEVKHSNSAGPVRVILLLEDLHEEYREPVGREGVPHLRGRLHRRRSYKSDDH